MDIPYEPTEEEIEAATWELKDQWSDGEERQHRTGSSAHKPYEVETVPLDVFLPPEYQT